MSYQEKRIKSGLAVTAAHLKLCDDNLRRADTASRNEFVEKAIEFYAGYLNAAQNPHFFDEMFTSEAQKKVETLSRTIGTGQYKIAVELAKLSRLLMEHLGLDCRMLQEVHQQCAEEVKLLNSVPEFGRHTGRN